jgi:arylsulfatase A-like enzyme
MRKNFTAALIILIAGIASAYAADRPSLVVVISIDQFRYDYLERFAPWFSLGGFNRFLKSGANFPNAYYPFANTFTGPGHASIGTGRMPSQHGIVGNTWFDRTATDPQGWENFFEDAGGYVAPNAPKLPPPYWYQTMTGAPRYCVEDHRVSGGMSPVTLAEDSLGDRLREKYPQSRVLSVALKDRAAILMAGRKANAAYWFGSSGFVSSSYYRSNPALFDFNQTITKYIPASGKWTLSGIITEEAMKKVTFDPPAAWPFKNARYGTHFDHPVPNVRAMTYTPFANDMLLDFAWRIVESEGLGMRTEPDLLFVGISAPDYIGHYYGPDSIEVAENAVLLDRSLEKFLDALDAKFHDRLLVTITADHGVQSTPEIAKLKDPKISAGRIDLRNPRMEANFISELPPARIEIERALAKKLNIPFLLDAPLSRALVAFFEEPSLYLNWERVAELKLDGERVKRALRGVISAMPGVQAVFTNSELMMTHAHPSELERAVRASFRADRSGDLIVVLKKNWIWSYGSVNTTHGQPLPDDQHVPVMFWGLSINSGRYEDQVSPTDIARTISDILGFQAAAGDASVLPCVDQRRAVLRTALAELEKGQPFTLVAAGDLFDVVAPVRETVRVSETMPAGYARVDKLAVSGDTANVTLWLGPIPEPPKDPGVIQLSCGTGHLFTLKRENGVWRVVSRGVAVC